MMGKGSFTGFAAITVAVGLLAGSAPPVEAFVQKGVGVVTALRGGVAVSHNADVAARERRPVQEPLKFRDDVFFLDTINTERDAAAKLLLRARSTFTIRELSQVQLREGTVPAPGATRSIVSILSGALRAIVQRDLRPQDEMEIHTPNAISAVRGTDIVVEVYRDTAPPLPPTVSLDSEVRPVSYEVAQAQAQAGQFISRWFVFLGELAVEGLVARAGEGVEKVGNLPPRLFRFAPDFMGQLAARFLVASGVGPAGAHMAQIVNSAQGRAVGEGRGAGAGFAIPTAAVLPVERAINSLNTGRELESIATFSGSFFVGSFTYFFSGMVSNGPLAGSFDGSAVNSAPFVVPLSCSPACSGLASGTARIRTPAGGGPGTIDFTLQGTSGDSLSATGRGAGVFVRGGSSSTASMDLTANGGKTTVPLRIDTR